MTEELISEESSGNVFADLGLEDAEEYFTRGKIGIQVLRLLKQRNLKQREISKLLGIPQPEVSYLMRGEFQRFTEGKLLTFLKRLDIEISLHLRPRHAGTQAAERVVSLAFAKINQCKTNTLNFASVPFWKRYFMGAVTEKRMKCEV